MAFALEPTDSALLLKIYVLCAFVHLHLHRPAVAVGILRTLLATPAGLPSSQSPLKRLVTELEMLVRQYPLRSKIVTGGAAIDKGLFCEMITGAWITSDFGLLAIDSSHVSGSELYAANDPASMLWDITRSPTAASYPCICANTVRCSDCPMCRRISPMSACGIYSLSTWRRETDRPEERPRLPRQELYVLASLRATAASTTTDGVEANNSTREEEGGAVGKSTTIPPVVQDGDEEEEGDDTSNNDNDNDNYDDDDDDDDNEEEEEADTKVENDENNDELPHLIPVGEPLSLYQYHANHCQPIPEFVEIGLSRTSLMKEAIAEKEAGNVAFAKGQKYYLVAMAHYTKAIQLYSDESVFFSNRALVYLKLGRYLECISDCTASLERRGNIKAYHRRAAAWTALGDYERACCDYQRALKFDNNNLNCLIDLEKSLLLLKAQRQSVLHQLLEEQRSHEHTKAKSTGKPQPYHHHQPQYHPPWFHFSQHHIDALRVLCDGSARSLDAVRDRIQKHPNSREKS